MKSFKMFVYFEQSETQNLFPVYSLKNIRIEVFKKAIHQRDSAFAWFLSFRPQVHNTSEKARQYG